MTKRTNNTMFYGVLFVVAVFSLGLAIGLNLLWFGVYEWIKQYFELSYLRASIAVGSVVWFFAMMQVMPSLTDKHMK